jgi:hypothetical protein
MINLHLFYLALFAVCTIYAFSKAVFFRRRNSMFCLRHDCKPAPHVPQKWWLFGLDIISAFEKSARERVFLNYTVGLFKASGSRTIALSLAPGTTYVWTMSPENAKAMMASKAEDFDISKRKCEEPNIGRNPSFS